MSPDAALPPGVELRSAAAATDRVGERNRQRARAGAAPTLWAPADLRVVVRHLAQTGAAALAGLSPAAVRTAWLDAVAAFLDRQSEERRGLEAELASTCRLSREGLDAGLAAVLGGASGAAANEVFRQAEGRRSGGLVAVLLASNLPALAVQPLLPALALGRPVLLKSPTAEPLFAPAFVRALVRREPRLAPALAAVTWPGGDVALEEPVLAVAERVIAYGDAPALADLERRAPGKLVAYGPKTSLAVVAADADLGAAAEGLARDVALFDQRGCLSVQAVYTDGDGAALARELAAALARTAERWPPGAADPASLGGVQQLRAEAALRGLIVEALSPAAAGTVVVDPLPAFRPGSGLRCVRVQPLPDLAELPRHLAPWAGRLQGASLAGEAASALAPALEALGVSRCAPPGELQSPNALWHNGGIHPLAALGGAEKA